MVEIDQNQQFQMQFDWVHLNVSIRTINKIHNCYFVVHKSCFITLEKSWIGDVVVRMQPNKWILIYFFSQMLYMTNGAYSMVDYIDLVGVYSIFRHISRWTHLTCYRNGECQISNLFPHCCQVFPINMVDQNIEIGTRLSLSYDIQSRFGRQFETMIRLMDTSSSCQGFVLDTTCNGYEQIFQKVRHLDSQSSSCYWNS